MALRHHIEIAMFPSFLPNVFLNKKPKNFPTILAQLLLTQL